MFRIEVWFLHIAIELNREVAPHTSHTLCNLLLLRRREQHLPMQVAIEIGAPLQEDVKLMFQLLRQFSRQTIHQAMHPSRFTHHTHGHKGATGLTHPSSRSHRIDRTTIGTSLKIHAMPQTRLLLKAIRQKTDLPAIGNLR